MSTGTPAPAFLRLGSTAPRRRLFCVPFAGGGAAAFRLWPRTLPADVELLAVQLPGRESRIRERPFDAIHDIVAAIQPAVAAAADLPYAIFGHSMGALVAFELALALEAAGGRPPSHLFVSARRAPDEPDFASPVHALPEAQFLDELQRRYGAVPEAIRQEPELLALLLPVLRADIRAIECYAPDPDRRVRCPVQVYGGIDDRHPVPAQLCGWQRVAEREVRVRLFAGDHFYLTTQRDALTADIAARWAEASVEVERV
jgi:surfactin synthase thioesterase subunit